MKILVDMDGVIADFEGKFLEDWRKTYPDRHYIPVEERVTFYVTDQYPFEIRNLVESIYHSPGFYRSLAPIPGALDALRELRKLGQEVFICTSPLSNYENCILEKYQWVEHYLGREWVQRVILTKDKTIISGDILVDDRPYVRGVETPRWEHVLYDQPYNRSEASKKRLTWENWRTVLPVSDAAG